MVKRSQITGILCNGVSAKLKGKSCRSVVWSVLTYGSERATVESGTGDAGSRNVHAPV